MSSNPSTTESQSNFDTNTVNLTSTLQLAHIPQGALIRRTDEQERYILISPRELTQFYTSLKAARDAYRSQGHQISSPLSIRVESDANVTITNETPHDTISVTLPPHHVDDLIEALDHEYSCERKCN